MYAAAFPRDELTSRAITADPHRAWGALIEKRHCPEWCDYSPGYDPKGHLMQRRLTGLEDDRKAFQRALDSGGKRLIWASIIVGGLIGLAALTSDSVAYRASIAAYYWLFPSQASPAPPALHE
jgi:hypothetical protein